jgi:DNA-binding XRE family transcriptional regulator
MNVQYIETPAGRFAVVPEAEFLALAQAAEDAADEAVIREFERKLAGGEEELLPAPMVSRMAAGESKVRIWREHRGLSAAQLAERAGVSAPYLSQIENGAREGSIETFKKIAAVLTVTIDDLV